MLNSRELCAVQDSPALCRHKLCRHKCNSTAVYCQAHMASSGTSTCKMSLRMLSLQRSATLAAAQRPCRSHHLSVAPSRSLSIVPKPSRSNNVPQQMQRRVAVASAEDPSRSLKETAALDDLIDKLLAAKSQQELARIVAENIFAIDPKFWLRVATRNDTAGSKGEGEKLKAMADQVMVLVDTVMRKTEQQLADSSRILQEIMSSAADDKGEWYLPLAPEQVKALRASLDKYEERLDEALLSNAFAWIRKCSEDRFDTMVQLIQKVLQLYAAKQLRGPESSGVEGVVNQVIYAEEAQWAPLITSSARDGTITEPAFMEELQKRMEATVLGLQSGSYAQRVQAEYLKEIESRAKSVFRELADSA